MTNGPVNDTSRCVQCANLARFLFGTLDHVISAELPIYLLSEWRRHDVLLEPEYDIGERAFELIRGPKLPGFASFRSALKTFLRTQYAGQDPIQRLAFELYKRRLFVLESTKARLSPRAQPTAELSSKTADTMTAEFVINNVFRGTPECTGQATHASEAVECDRRAAVDAYIAAVYAKTGEHITRTSIWKSAGYKSRSEFEKWERNDPKRRNMTADMRFRQILAKKPHLK
jgi:hypothetical protein